MEISPTTAAEKRRRDALGLLCFALHFGVMIFIIFGWALPERGALLIYLVLLPAVVVQWQFNRNSCVLNNMESLFRTGRWRDPSNVEEGAWLRTLARNALGLTLRPAYLEAFVYVVMALFWGLGLIHLLRL